MNRVWLVETGEYEDRGVFTIADSLEAAVVAVKRTYGPPYLVTWDELTQDHWQKGSEEWTLTGHFEGVLHYSTKHTAKYDIRPIEIEHV